MAKAKNAIPQGLHSVTPHLVLENAAAAIDWYTRAFGAEDLGRSIGPDGKIMHAEIRIGNSHLYLNDVMGDGGKSAKGYGGSPVMLWIYTEDADALFNRALAAGAKVVGGPMGQMQDQFWGDRCGVLSDPEGLQWTIATRKEDLTREEMDKRAADFFKQLASQGTNA